MYHINSDQDNIYATCETPNGKTITAHPRRRLIRKALHSLTSARVISTFSVRIVLTE